MTKLAEIDRPPTSQELIKMDLQVFEANIKNSATLTIYVDNIGVSPNKLRANDLDRYIIKLNSLARHTNDPSFHARISIFMGAAIAISTRKKTIWAIWIAAISVIITLAFGVVNYYDSQIWQNSQLDKLEQINNSIQHVR